MYILFIGLCDSLHLRFLLKVIDELTSVKVNTRGMGAYLNIFEVFFLTFNKTTF